MSPVIIRLDSAADFSSFKPVSHPIGEPVAQTRMASNLKVPGAITGFWECTVGKFRRELMNADYAYVISGEGSFIPDGGEAVDFRAGDAIYFGANIQGTWVIHKTLQTTYFILD